MTLWPFHGARKRPRSSTVTEQPQHEQPSENPLLRSQSRKKKQKTNAHDSRRYSFSPDEQDHIYVAHRQPVPRSNVRQSQIPPPNPDPRRTSRKLSKKPPPHLLPVVLDPENPQLVANRHVSRRTSRQQRQQEARAREAEIKALSQRKADDNDKSMYMGDNGQFYRYSSHRSNNRNSANSSDRGLDDVQEPECTTYRITSIGVLAPRPTLRHETSLFSDMPYRSSSVRRRLADDPQISKDLFHSRKRIDNLVDDMDASELRELLERDKRRKELRRQKERLRAERKLLAKVESSQHRDVSQPASPIVNLERGVLGRDAFGLSSPPSAVVVHNPETVVRATTPKEPEHVAHQRHEDVAEPEVITETAEVLTPEPHVSLPNPVSEQVTEPSAETEVTVVNREPSKRKKLLGLARSLSRSTKHHQDPITLSSISVSTKSTVAAPERKRSHSTIRTRLSWSHLVNWATRPHRNSKQSFSSSLTNIDTITSVHGRSSLTVDEPLSPVASPLPDFESQTVTVLKPGIPRRNRSRFREHLPELPPSPPESRGSADHERTPHVSTEHLRPDATESTSTRIDTPNSWARDNPSPDQPTVSLASLDSEGSWFSGRLATKKSGNLRANRHGRTTPHESLLEEEDDGATTIAADAYMAHITTPEVHIIPSSSDMAMAVDDTQCRNSSDDEGVQGMRWGDVVRRQPTFGENDVDAIEHRADTMVVTEEL